MATINGSNLDDSLFGDTAGGPEDDEINGLAGNDIIQGRDGNDTLSGGDGNDSITGGTGNDSIDGGADADSIDGGDGDDTVDGGSGANTVIGGDGNDGITTGAGNDSVVGDFQQTGAGGNDTISTGDGDDYVYDALGDNEISTGAGNDTIEYATGPVIDAGAGNDQIRYYLQNSALDMSVLGGDGDDNFFSRGGNQGQQVTLDGGAGNDTIGGSSRAEGETILGGDGDDSVNASSGTDYIDGGTGNDILRGDNDNDTILGGAGDDTITGGAGDDEIDGGSTGETNGDTAVFSGNRANFAILEGPVAGSVRVLDLNGSQGDDTLTDIEFLQFTDQTLEVSTLTLGAEIDGDANGNLLNGTAGDDLIDGGAGPDTINGLDGSDSIDGSNGQDVIDGGAGNDRVFGGIGNDTIDGGAGDDTLVGGEGNDEITDTDGTSSILGGEGDDLITTGAGNDSVVGDFQQTGAGGNDTISTGDGDDYVYDALGDNEISTGAGNDTIEYATGPVIDAGAGNDQIRYYLQNSALDMSVLGGDGDDNFFSRGGNQGQQVTLDGGAGNDTIGGSSRAEGETILGGDGDDSVNASSGTDYIDGGTGNDILRGDNDNDTILGGAGDDTIEGGNGNDSLFGGADSDTITGGAGDDTIDGGDGVNPEDGNIAVFSGVLSNYTIATGGLGEATVTDTVGGDGTDVISNVAILRFADQDSIIGTNPGILIEGDGNDNTLNGTEGDDTINGLDGNDVIDGSGGLDIIDGGLGNDSIAGGSGDDVITDTAGANTVIGGDGNDGITTGAGNDSVVGDFQQTGAGGNDTISTGDGDDYVYDALGDNEISTGAGNDTIEYATGPVIDAGAGNDQIRYYLQNSALDMSVLGGDGDDNFFSRGGNQGQQVTLDGGAGNDTIGGSSRAEGETILGGDGDDSVNASSGTDYIDGGTGNDILRGDNDNDTILGGDGDDTITGGNGDDEIDGGSTGETNGDTAVFSGNRANFAILEGPVAGSVRVLDLNGSQGDDTLTDIEFLQFTDQTLEVSTLTLGAEIDGDANGNLLNGTAGDDLIDGGAGPDTINGLDGSDSIDGSNGQDVIDAGAGNDRVFGGIGNDTIDGGAGDDTLVGGEGNDEITDTDGTSSILGGEGDDLITTGAGNDSVVGDFQQTGAGGNDTISTGDGDDYVYDALGDNEISTGAGNDTIEYATGPVIDAGAGNDQIRYYLQNSALDMSVLGGDGDDNFFSRGGNQGQQVTLDGGAGNDTIGGSSRAEGETILGGDGDDSVNASSGTDYIDGGTGNDILRGDNDNDTILGGAGDDTLTGGRGDDTLDGGTENTSGGDVAIFSGTRSQYAVIGDSTGLTVTDFIANRDGTDVLVNVETLRFSDGDVPVGTGLTGVSIEGTELSENGIGTNPGALIGTIVNDTINGNGGDDSIVGLDGVDVLTGGAGDDTIRGGGEDDDIDGGTGDDVITGGEGNDAIAAGPGNDTVTFSGNAADYDISGDSVSATVEDLDAVAGGDDGTDVITGARVLRFADGDVFLNNAPQTDAEAVSTNENQFIDIPFADLLDGDVDPDGDPLSIVALNNAQNGTIQQGSNFARFIPDAGYSGPAQFDYVVSDGFETTTQTVSVTVIAGNGRPTANDDNTYSTDEDTVLTITAPNGVLVNDTDPENDPLTAQLIGGAANGIVVLSTSGAFTYTPNADFNGQDQFTYRASDGNGGTDTATVRITVNPIPDLPFAGDDAAGTTSGTSVAINVLANDGDADGPISISAVGTPLNGTAVVQPNGTIIYTPDATFLSGIDSFDYDITDSDGNVETATVTVSVAPGRVEISTIGSTDRFFEGNSGITTATFLVTRTGWLDDTVEVDYTIVGSGFAPVAGDDVSGTFPVTDTITFLPGVTQQTVTVDIAGDTTPELHELMVMTLQNAETTTGDVVTLGDQQHYVRVLNDDAGGAVGDPGSPNGPGGPGGPGGTGGGGTPGGGGNPGGGTPGGGTTGGGTSGGGGTGPLPPVPPPPPPPGGGGPKEADVWGDPHLVNFDGLRWDFQAVGEFVATRGTASGDDFQVQMRYTPFGNSQYISGVGAVATEIDGISVAVYRDDQIPDEGDVNLWIGGQPVVVNALLGPVSVGTNGGEVYFDGNNTYTIVHPSGEQIMMKIFPSYMNVCVFTSGDLHPDGTLEGLLGNSDGNFNNDFFLADGTDLGSNPSFQTIYGVYADSWRVSDTTSLFDYSAGEGTADKTDLNFPAGVLRISDFPQAAIDEATAIVDAQGISNPGLRDDAILDILLTGDANAAVGADNLAATPVAGVELTNAPTVQSAVSIASLSASELESDAGDTQSFEFSIFRIGDTSAALTVDWAVSSAQADADDFGGTLPSGTVTFDVGEDEHVITIDVSGDDLPEFDETFFVNISLPTPGGPAFINSRAQSIIGNDDGPLPTTFSVIALTPQVAEGTGTPSLIRFAVIRSNSTLEEDTVTISFAGSATDGAEASDIDGGFPSPQTLTFIPGEDVKVIQLVVNGDSTFEANEGIVATLSNAVGGTITQESDTALIINDDGNAAPVAGDDLYSVAEDGVLVAGLPGVGFNDNDPDGDTLTLSLTTNPTNGSVTFNANGTFEYTPNTGFDGVDSFTYTASDGNGGSDIATVTINVIGDNSAPAAVDDSYGTAFGTALNVTAALGVLANDTDPENDPLTVSLLSGPASGLLTLNADGSFDYVPTGTFSGDVTFTYEVTDGDLTDQGEVTITVAGPTNEAPVAVLDTFELSEDAGATALGNLLANDTDAEGDAFVSRIFDTDGTELTVGVDNALVDGGILRVTASGDVTFDPAGAFEGLPGNPQPQPPLEVLGLSYEISDGEFTSTADFDIGIRGANDAPVGTDDAFTTDFETVLTIAAAGVLSNDSDPDGDPLSAVLDSGPANGSLTLNANGSFEYTPDQDFSGVDTFTYFADDGTTNAAAATTVSITVRPEVGPDLAFDDAVTVTIDALNAAGGDLFRVAALNTQNGLLNNDTGLTAVTDINGAPIQEGVWFDGDSGGQFRVFSGGVVDFRNAGTTVAQGDQTSFSYVATDGADSDSATFTLTIGGSSPLAEDDSFGVTAEALAFEGMSQFRIAAAAQGTDLLENDTTEAKIFAVNGDSPLPEGEWFDGDSGGQFRIFESGVVHFRNRGEQVEAGDETGFTYTIIENGVVDTAHVSLTVSADTGPAQDDALSISELDLLDAGAGRIRLAALNDDSDILGNDFMIDEIALIDGSPLANGEWFDGNNGGQFRVFERGIVDFRNQGETIEAGETTGFTYGVLEDGVYDTAVFTLTVDTFDFI